MAELLDGVGDGLIVEAGVGDRDRLAGRISPTAAPGKDQHLAGLGGDDAEDAAADKEEGQQIAEGELAGLGGGGELFEEVEELGVSEEGLLLGLIRLIAGAPEAKELGLRAVALVPGGGGEVEAFQAGLAFDEGGDVGVAFGEGLAGGGAAACGAGEGVRRAGRH